MPLHFSMASVILLFATPFFLYDALGRFRSAWFGSGEVDQELKWEALLDTVASALLLILAILYTFGFFHW